jgi:inosine-uridine nucleoside N-ribohydrolase
VIQGSPEKVTLVTLGPLTNVAQALEAEPSLVDYIEMIYVMGGAVSVPGNVGFIVTDNAVAEWNIYVDPHAAAIVFESGAPITLAMDVPTVPATMILPAAGWGSHHA